MGTPEYAALITMFICILVIFNWMWIQSLRPAVKFAGLHGDLEQLMLEMSGKRYMPRQSVLRITRKLDRLQVQYPDLQDTENWAVVLPYFAVWSEMKDIKAARRYRPGVEEFM